MTDAEAYQAEIDCIQKEIESLQNRKTELEQNVVKDADFTNWVLEFEQKNTPRSISDITPRPWVRIYEEYNTLTEAQTRAKELQTTAYQQRHGYDYRRFRIGHVVYSEVFLP